MITVYDKGTQDFSTNGLFEIGQYALIAQITEELNGDYELELQLAPNARLNLVQNDMILRAPAPMRETPEVALYTTPQTGNVIYRVSTSSSNLRLRTGPGTNYKILKSYKKGTEVIVTSTSNSSWYKVVAPDGKSGYMSSQYLTFVRREYSPPVQTGIVKPKQTREQLFRIYSIAPTLEGITIKARHIFYDMLGNYIKTASGSTSNVTGATAAQRIFTSAIKPHSFTVYADVQNTGTIDIARTNPVEAMMGDEGLIGVFGGELLRDNFDVYYSESIGYDRGVTLAYRKNMTGMEVNIDTSNLVTQIIPIGFTKSGELIYLDETFVNSARINDYDAEVPRILEQEYREIKVGDGYANAAAVKAAIRAAAQAEFAEGIDLPTVEASVEYIDLKRALSDEDFTAYTDVFLGDTVRIRHENYGFDIPVKCTAYCWDCLHEEFLSIELGTRKASLSSLRIDPDLIPDSSLSGRKLGIGAIEEVNIGDDAISTPKIEEGAVDRTRIANLAVGDAQIDNAAITSAKIALLAVGEAHIQNLAVTAAKIADATITNAKIQDATIETAKIALGAITTALIQQGAIGTAQIADGSITDAKIVELTANKINAGTIAVERLVIVGSEQSIVFGINTANGTPQLSYTTIDGGALTQRSITADRIVAGAITANEIAAATILANNIAAGAITAAKIDVADLAASSAFITAIVTPLIQSNLGEGLNISSNTSLKLAVAGGGRNLIQDSESRVVSAGSSNNYSYWTMAENLEQGKPYTLSFGAIERMSGTATKVTAALYYAQGGVLEATHDFNVSGSAQSWTFTPPVNASRSWNLILYVGARGSTAGNVITYKNFKLEHGTIATDWTAAPEDLQANLSALSTLASGKTTVFYQPGAPTTGMITGDIWYDIDDATGKIYRYSGSGWVEITDVALKKAITAASAAQTAAGNALTAANGKAAIYVQPNAPTLTAADAGDMWVDTDGTNIVYTWSGSSWINTAVAKLKTSFISIENNAIDIVSGGNVNVAAGAGFNVNSGNVRMRTSEFTLQITESGNPENVLMEMSAEGGVGFDNLYADNVISPSIVNVYAGPTTIYVYPEITLENSDTYFKTLRDALSRLNGHYLQSDVTIRYYTSTAQTLYENQRVEICGISGTGGLTITGQYTNKTVLGYFLIANNTVHVRLEYMNLFEIRGMNGSNRQPYLIDCQKNALVEISNCTLDSNNVSFDVIYSRASTMQVISSNLYNGITGVELYSGLGSIKNCAGVCTNAIIAYGATAYCYGTVPYGSRIAGENGEIRDAGVTQNSGTAPAPIPPETTAEFTATLARSHRNGWESGAEGNVMQGAYDDSGYSSSTKWWRGCMWFNLSALSGRTVKAATLKIKRITGSGSGSATRVYLATTTATGASGTPAVSTFHGQIGTIERNQTKTFTIPAAAVQEIANGTRAALMLYEQPYNFGNYNYSRGYSRMYGTNSSYPPTLSVTYA